MTTKHPWVDSLHPDRQVEFFALPKEQQRVILDRREATRRTAFYFFTQMNENINGRERWVTGVENLHGLVKDPRYALKLAMEGRVKEVEALRYLLVNFGEGWHDDEKNNDKRLYSLMSQAYAAFTKVGHDSLDLVGIAKHFRQHPELQPIRDSDSTALQVAEKKAKRLGARIKRNRTIKGITQGEMAKQAGVCEKTIKNMEAGKPISTHTLLAIQEILNQSGREQASKMEARKPKP